MIILVNVLRSLHVYWLSYIDLLNVILHMKIWLHSLSGIRLHPFKAIHFSQLLMSSPDFTQLCDSESLAWWLLMLFNLLLCAMWFAWLASWLALFWLACVLPCNEWQNFFVLLQSSFSDKLNIENDGWPVTSLTIFRNLGKHSIRRSPSNDEYVSRRINPLHLCNGKRPVRM